MMKRMIFLMFAGLLIFGIGFAQAAGQQHGPEFENEVEVDHGLEAEQCPGGGQIFLGATTITPGTTMSGITMNLRNQDCVAKTEKVETENKKINEDVHVKGEVHPGADNKIEIKDMTITHDNNRVTSTAGDDFTVTCTKTIPTGTFDSTTGTLQGTVTVTCNATGTMKQKIDDLLLGVLPHR